MQQLFLSKENLGFFLFKVNTIQQFTQSSKKQFGFCSACFKSSSKYMTLKGYVCSGLSEPVLGTTNCVSNSCENGVCFLFVFFCGSCSGSLQC